MKQTIVVPATSANLGPGFDSIGMAVSMELRLELIEPQENWKIIHPFGEQVANDESNLIVQTALQVCPTIQPYLLKCTSEVPLTRGLGSSSSAIVAGIELANIIGDLQLSNQEKVQIATRMEGHPDNVAPAILGGIVVASYDAKQDRVFYQQKSVSSDIELVAVIPSVELSTEASRKVLPEQFSYAQAVRASSIASVLVAALWENDWEQAGELMEQDLFHEPYRTHLVPCLQPVRTLAKQHGAFATYLSGAGPTILIVCSNKHTEDIMQAMEQLPEELQPFEVKRLTIQNSGVFVQ